LIRFADDQGTAANHDTLALKRIARQYVENGGIEEIMTTRSQAGNLLNLT